jgi:hypothetical protein
MTNERAQVPPVCGGLDVRKTLLLLLLESDDMISRAYIETHDMPRSVAASGFGPDQQGQMVGSRGRRQLQLHSATSWCYCRHECVLCKEN